MKRRDFIRKSAGTLGTLGLFQSGLSNVRRESKKDQLERRPLGKTGANLSIIGFGAIVVRDATSKEAQSRVSEAIAYGVNYFDASPSYGNSEPILGEALKAYRKDVFLSCKTGRRTKKEAKQELENSLKNLKTDYFDLYQLHAVSTLEDVSRVFSSGGAMEALQDAKAEGKIKHIGFSAHSVDAALSLMNEFEFDTIMFPVSSSSWYSGNFGPQVLQKAYEKEMGIIALKAMAKGPWPDDVTERIEKCWYEPTLTDKEASDGLRFTLSHPVTTAIPPGDENLFKLALKLGNRFTPLSDYEVERIKTYSLDQEPLFRHNA